MTRIEIEVERLVLRGVPAGLAEGIGPLVAERLSELATADRRGDEPPRWADPARGARAATDRESLAAQVARETWASTRDHLRAEAP